MSAPIVHAGVHEYVAAVRLHLDDLTAEEVDELTGGLEADLDDALGELPAAGRTPDEQFGPPATYAAELRAAAGLPPRADQGGRRGVAARVSGWRQRVVSHPRWPAVRDFLVTIRPAWWVARAIVATALIAAVFGLSAFVTFWVGVAAIVVSVQLGRRGTARRTRTWRVAIGAGNVLAALLLLPALSWLDGGRGAGDAGTEVAPAGVQVRNIFPYDDQGRPLTGVQLYDENGSPVEIGELGRLPVYRDDGSSVSQVPAVDAGGQQRWNVYPLREEVRTPDPVSGEQRPDPAGPRAASPPAVAPGPLLAGGAGPASPSPAAPPPAPEVPTTAHTAG